MSKRKDICTDLVLFRRIKCKEEFPDRNILFADEEDVKRDSYLDANLEPDTIRVAMVHIQNDIITRVTGECLADQMRTLIQCGMIHGVDYRWYRELLDTYLFPIFVYGIPTEIAVPVSFKDRNAGRVRQTDDSYSHPALGELKYTNQWYRDRVDFYIMRAVRFLRCNSRHFQCLCGCGCPCGCSTAPFHEDFSTGLNLAPETTVYERAKWRR